MGDHSSRWQRLRLFAKFLEVRLRFVAVLVAVALLIGYWDTIKNYWDKWTRPSAAALLQLPDEEEFFCPMDPQVTRSSYDPNGRIPHCPICGMPLSRRQKSEKQQLPEGVTGRVQISPERIRMAGIRSVEVGYRPLVRKLSTVGSVLYDESRLSRVVSRVGGYVEKLYVDKTYATVKQGDPLAEIYSPELYSAAQELVLLSKRNRPSDLVESARKRLMLLGVGRQEIDQIARSGKAVERLVIRSPQAGFVIGKYVVAGARVEPGMTLLDVADLSTVWIEADVYEKDVSLLHAGQKIVARADALVDRVISGRVALVYPRMETSTRTNRVRFDVENPEFLLRPGMYVTVQLETPIAEIEPFRSRLKTTVAAQTAREPGGVLAVPERAVVDTGDRQIVYVEREPGLFEGVEVRLGPRCDDQYPVIEGLEAGQRVAAAGAFLVDAETRLNPSAAAAYFGASGGPKSAGRMTVEGKPEKPAPIEIKRPTPEMIEKLAELPPEDRDLAGAQVICPITGLPLGAMGKPHKLLLEGQTVLLCCRGCVAKARSDPQGTLRRVAAIRAAAASQKAKP
jgi:Cu(I)/Ag(I) efflux system membrane fusion protein